MLNDVGGRVRRLALPLALFGATALLGGCYCDPYTGACYSAGAYPYGYYGSPYGYYGYPAYAYAGPSVAIGVGGWGGWGWRRGWGWRPGWGGWGWRGGYAWHGGGWRGGGWRGGGWAYRR